MEIFFYHFVPLMCADIYVKFHDHEINGSKIRQGVFSRF